MEKTNKKSKSFIALLLAILFCIAVVLGIGGFTYAKYISQKSLPSQTANVAKWGYVISADTSTLFGDAYGVENSDATTQTVIPYSTTDGSVGVKATANSDGSAGEHKVVAPGTSGSMTFSVTGTAEVRSKITIEVSVSTVQLKWTNSNNAEQTYEPIKWTLTDNNNSAQTTTYESYAKMIEGLNALDAGYQSIDPNTNFDGEFSYTLSWAWAFEDSTDKDTYDLYDTILGARMAANETNNAGVDKAFKTLCPNGTQIRVYYDSTSSTWVVQSLAAGESWTTKNDEGKEVANTNIVNYTATTSVSLDLTITVEQIQGGVTTLAAGLYDKDYKLLAAYATSGMDVTINYTSSDYQSATTSPYYILHNTYTATVHIVLPDGITQIGKYAFESCTSLTSVTIPDSVTKIGDQAFQKCSSLESITIPGSVKTIGDNAFMDCEKLTSVTIKSGVVAIWKEAFSGCKSLTSITIPASVVNIQEYAFQGCSALTSVYYEGTAEQWSTLISSTHFGSNNTSLTDATIYYYSASEPTLTEDGTAYDGNYWHYDTDGVTPVVWTKETETA